jgi:disulfide bond formation protein DsbB
MLIVMTGVFFGLASMNADGAIYAVAMMSIGGTAAHASSRVVMHYGPHRRP